MKYISLFATILVVSTTALAEDVHHAHGGGGIMPHVKMAQNTSSVHLSMDKSELVRLSEPAASIIVGNPVHASVLMDNPQLLVIVPRAPGATYFSVLNSAGDVILQRHIIVAAPKENYIRVRKATCGENAKDCINTETYFCEQKGMCHEIISAADEDHNTSAENNNSTEGADNNGTPPNSLDNNSLPQ